MNVDDIINMFINFNLSSHNFYPSIDGTSALISQIPDIENCPLNLDGEFRIAHFIYSFSFIILMLRMLNFYSNSRNLGPKVIMITRMFMDMVQFLALLIIFVLAYGIATQAETLNQKNKIFWFKYENIESSN